VPHLVPPHVGLLQQKFSWGGPRFASQALKSVSVQLVEGQPSSKPLTAGFDKKIKTNKENPKI
jgi:hypothetical protein